MNDSSLRANLDAECAATSQAVEFVTTSRLKKERSGEQLVNLFRKIDLVLDTKIEDWQKRRTPDEPIACRAGCDHCCHRVVFATALEAMDVMAHIYVHFSDEQKAELTTRLNAYVAAVGPQMGHDLNSLRVPCPMLEEGRCSVYDSRPLACRSQVSLNVPTCIEARNDPSRSFPTSEPESALGKAAQQGLASGMIASGLWSEPRDFARVVALVLADPSLGSLYMSGRPIFELCAPVVEPTGTSEVDPIARKTFLLRTVGDAEAAFEVGPADGPVQQMFRMQVPMSYRQSVEIDYWRKRMEIAFEEFASNPADPREKFDAISAYYPLSLSYQQRDDKDLLSRIGDYLTNDVATKVLPDLCVPIPPRKQTGKLRIGYIGTGLGNSSGTYWATGWLKNHSSEFETFVFYLNATPSSTSEEYNRHAHHFFHCPGPVPQIARFIKQQNLDVLIYPDATFEGRNIQFATLRLAPLQCTGWGDPETTGMPNIDCFLSSDWMEPENADAHYREKLVRLPRTGVCYPRPERRGAGLQKASFGLDDGPLFLCLQAPSKLLPQWDWLFKEICDRTGRPIVFFAYPNTACRLVERRLKAAGVRALFMPFLNMMQICDLISLADATLDAIGWSGGITTLLALQQKKPVITLPGEFRRGRHAMAFLKAANAPDLIATNPDDYIDLACNGPRRDAALQKLSPELLFDDTASVTALEEYLLSLNWT